MAHTGKIAIGCVEGLFLKVYACLQHFVASLPVEMRLKFAFVVSHLKAAFLKLKTKHE